MTAIWNFLRSFYGKLAAAPARNMLLFLLIMGVIWSIQCAVCQSMVPLDTKEAVSWGAQWQWGYYKHPPLAAWLAYLCHKVFFECDFFLYLLAQLCVICGIYYSYRFAREFFDERRSVMAALVLNFLYYYSPSSMSFNPNFVEMALLPFLSFYFLRCLRSPTILKWLIFGFFAGIAVLGKYSAGFLLLSLFLMMLTRKEYRKQIFSTGPWLAFLVFLLVLLPHILWLLHHDFSCFTYLDNSVTKDDRHWTFIFSILGMLLYPFAMTIVAFFLPFLPRRNWKRQVPFALEPFQWGLLLCMVPGLCFIVIGLCGGNVAGMWFSSLTSWAPVAVMAACPWFVSRKTFRKFFLLLIVFTSCMLIGMTLDAACSARSRLHLDSAALQTHVQAFLKTHQTETNACAVGCGEISFACEMYLPWHPVSADTRDPLSMNRVLPQIQKKGGILISTRNNEAHIFIRDFCRPDSGIVCTPFPLPYKALLSKQEVRRYYIAYLPPGCLQKENVGTRK